MLILKHYFMSEMERFRKEREVLRSRNGLKAEEVFALDDKELNEIYESKK